MTDECSDCGGELGPHDLHICADCEFAAEVGGR